MNFMISRGSVRAILTTLFVLALPPLIIPGRIDWLAVTLILLAQPFLIASIQAKRVALTLFLSCYIYLLVYPFYTLSLFGQNPLANKQITAMSPETFFIVLSSIVLTYTVSTLFYNKSSENEPLTTIAEKSRKIGIAPFFVIITALILYFYQRDFSSVISSRDAMLNNEESSTITFMNYFFKSMPAFACLYYMRDTITNRGKIFSIPFTLSLIILLIVNNPVNSPRILSLSCLLIAFFPLLIHRGIFTRYIGYVPIFIFLILPFTSLLRFGLGRLTIENYRNMLSSGEFSAMMIFNDAITHDLDARLYTGLKVISAFGIVIPRSIWSDKNDGTGIQAAKSLDYFFTNVGMPPLFDFISDFGYAGALLYALLIGALIIYIDRRIHLSGRTRTSLAIAAILLSSTPLLCRGDFTLYFVVQYSLISSAILTRQLMRLRL